MLIESLKSINSADADVFEYKKKTVCSVYLLAI